MRVIVTGGAGFIGSHLVDRLLAEGCEVKVLDNLAVGRLSNLAHHQALQGSRLFFEQVDVADLESIRPHFEGVEQVYHLAGMADIVPSIENPVTYFRANDDGTLAVTDASRAAGVKRLVYAASSSCYGIPQQYPTDETSPIQPQYPYALTKYLGEQIVLHWGQVYGLPVISLRLFNVYGPRARTSGTYGAVMGVFLAQKLAGKPLTIVGDGTQTRDFTYVSDVVDAFWTAAQSQLRQEIFNVGSGGTYQVNQLAKLIGGERIQMPKRPGEPDCTFANIAKIRALLGWEPRVSFEEGVARVLEHIELWRDAPVWTPESIQDATRAWFAHLTR